MPQRRGCSGGFEFMRRLDEYRPIVGDRVLGSIYREARRLTNRHVVHINSTGYGGGVAEILTNLVQLLNDAGVDSGWRVLLGTPDFFTVTKKFHNALQGNGINLTRQKKDLFLETNERFSSFSHLDHDCVIVHDPQPLPLIRFNKKTQPWIWRCHIDITQPNEALWDYLKSFILRYDMMIISNEKFRKRDLPVEQRIVLPSIDPLSPKNMDLSRSLIDKILKKFAVPLDKPLLTQVSRFDPWKDPEGVLKVFELVRERVDCRLVLCGNMAADDPQGFEIFQKMQKRAARYLKTGDVLFIPVDNQILVNVLQRVSAVILQKSLREGFGLTVSEALWKGTPVVASRVGGIPEQVIDGRTGYLVEPDDIPGCAERVIDLLENPEGAAEMGKNGRDYVRERFLITRHLLDYLKLLGDILESGH
jgi:trehalose synthase